MNHKRNEQGFHHIGLLMLVIAVSVIALVGWRVAKTGRGNSSTAILSKPTSNLVEAEKQGKQYSQNTCKGTDIKKLDHLPIDAENITRVLPYGGTVGAHVMPISHAYIWPGEFNSPRDKYNVYAMADSTLYYISSRSINVDTGQAKKTEYSLNFSVSCIEFYYYDLMTSLSPDLQKLIDAHPAQQAGGNAVQVNIPVKAGQLLGKIGGQTLDYAVWDFTKNLSDIVVPEHYERDFPRIHLVSPYDYVTDEVKKVLLDKSMRTAEPIAGKVDYDIDGKLIGGWFEENTKFYEGLEMSRYWAGHLAIIPNELDPTFMGVSIGTWKPNKEAQFGISKDATDPRTVGVETGIIKYDLFNVDFTLADGSHWSRMSFARDLKAFIGGPVQGCGLFQLTEARKLKAEFFPNKPCGTVGGFSSASKVYTR
jgi:hypothetical protein